HRSRSRQGFSCGLWRQRSQTLLAEGTRGIRVHSGAFVWHGNCCQAAITIWEQSECKSWRSYATVARVLAHCTKDARQPTLPRAVSVLRSRDLREWLQVSPECFESAAGLSLCVQ